jgi:multidrug efflux pump subunit AcrA (membrane-fusion protein)
MGGARSRAGRQALGAGLLGVALAILTWGCSKSEESIPRVQAETPPPAVRVEPVTRRRVPTTLTAVGTVHTVKRSVVSSRLVAAITAVRVVEGQRVERGQALVELDRRDVEAEARRAEAAVHEARDARHEVERQIAAAERGLDAARAQQEVTARTLARYRSLRDRELIALQEYDEVEARARSAIAELARQEETRAALIARRAGAGARIDQAEAAQAGARVAVGHASIAAPLDGAVVSKTAEVGALAAPGVPLLTLDEERYRLEVAVEESEVRRLSVGSLATVAVDAVGLERPARVVEVVPAADPGSRTFVVKLELPAVPGLRAGLYGRAAIPLGERSALTVPASALVVRGQLEGVFVVGADRVARLRVVRTGRRTGDVVEVLSGVTEGESVVVEGLWRVTDGAVVERRG